MGRATLVCMDLKTRKATPLPEAAIERLSPWKMRARLDTQACRSGVRTTSPSSSSVTLIWHDSREFGFTS